ncbi:glycosyl hydrolase [Mucilaginibacter agri]|uniref:Asl1-like glycosyl hydrolase catalytic domain-containing protein n=1 Tax=Mucilaginibacter agri TaxID=2695265 RepID=A0A965ZJP4_9SPHI|nr:glycosyl hydrolase [Mucilaginibacter agri]NCD72390.1 hypothetical protein [Mucilaginibacter agri]
MDLITGMGMQYYKFDVMTQADGSITVPYLFTPLKNAAIAAKVKLIPDLTPTTLDFSATEAKSYAAGKLLGANFAQKYGPYFTFYILGNEMDNRVILPGKTGNKVTDYDPARFKIVAAYLKGMDEGVKSTDPVCRTMIDASWLHYGFLQMLQDYGVNFDIVAYHWYSEMEGAAANAPYNIPDITVKLASLFTKPIWFTEVNKRYNTTLTYEYDQDMFFKKFLVKCRNNPRVHALIVYELFDEPQKISNLLEANYGIIKWTAPYLSWKYKEAANNFLIN